MLGDIGEFLVDGNSFSQTFPDARQLCPVPSDKFHQALAASSVLLGLDLCPEKESLQSHLITQVRTNPTFNVILQPLPEAIWERLQFDSHRICTNRDVIASLESALNHLEALHFHYLNCIADVMPNIAVVEIRQDYRGNDSLITSSSFPVLPYVGFVSSKAMRHIPPNTVVSESSSRLLAENLFHEAIHQVVNLSLLTNDIFVESYASRTSPRIEIPWRYGQRHKRNQRWELDRTLHAAIVYLGLMSFRRRELENLETGKPCFVAFYQAATDATHVLPYLCDQLGQHRKYFTSHGHALLDALHLDQKREVSRTQKTLKGLGA